MGKTKPGNEATDLLPIEETCSCKIYNYLYHETFKFK